MENSEDGWNIKLEADEREILKCMLELLEWNMRRKRNKSMGNSMRRPNTNVIRVPWESRLNIRTHFEGKEGWEFFRVEDINQWI